MLHSPFFVALLCSILPLRISGAAIGTLCSKYSTCESGSICQEKKCRVKEGDSCAGHEKWCVLDTLCDLGKCRASPGTPCSEDRPCNSRSVCQKGKCRVKEGESCTGHEKWCVLDTICDLGKCRGLTSYTKAVNAALYRPSYASSLHNYYTKAKNANDGNKTETNVKSCLMTDWVKTPYSFWRVDLEDMFKIIAVDIWNRADCCGQRLADFYIYVAKHKGNKNIKKDEHLNDEEVCLHHPDSVGLNKVIRLVCDVPLVGQYVTLYMVGHKDKYGDQPTWYAPLQLCEVEVKAVPIKTFIEGGQVCNDPKETINEPAICQKEQACVAIQENQYKCKVPVGSSCSGWNDKSCDPSSGCDGFKCNSCAEYTCRIANEGNCSGNEKWCRMNSLCDQGWCYSGSNYRFGDTRRTDLAEGQKAYASSTKTGHPTKANDGKVNVKGFESKPDDGSFWRVDLKKHYQIVFVKIYTTLHAQMGKFTVYVAKFKGTKDLSKDVHLDNEEICVHYPAVMDNNMDTLDLYCDTPAKGRYVTLYMEGHTRSNGGYVPLQLYEVQMRGHKVEVRQVNELCSTQVFELPYDCEQGLECEPDNPKYPYGGSYCKVPLGGDCSKYAFKKHCARPLVCLGGVCRIDYMGDCNEETKQWCKTDTFCSDNKCRLKTGGSCSGERRNYCADPVVCDNLDECKQTPGSLCFDKAKDCVSGAVCTEHSNIFKCQCDSSTVADSLGALCVPEDGKVAGACLQGAKKCLDPNAKCKDGKCCCETGTMHKNNYTCNVGAACVSDGECGLGNICANAGLTNAKCVLGYNQACGSSQTLTCVQGTTCDTSTSTCRIGLKGNCTMLEDSCVPGAVCEYGEICKGKVDRPCSSDAQCMKGAVCDTGSPRVCKMAVGYNCEGGSKKDCVSKAVCDDDFVCRLKVKESCHKDTSCCHGAECEHTSNTCRIKLLHDCSNNRDGCVEGAVCDIFNKCGLKHDGSCKIMDTTNKCVAGATCKGNSQTPETGVCTCYAAIATARQDGSCNPKRGQLGHSCSSQSDCQDPNAICIERQCRCNKGFAVDPSNLECKVAPGSNCTKYGCVSGSVCHPTGVCLLTAGQSCDGAFQAFCDSSTICEDRKCRVNTNEDCSGDLKGLCRNHTVCDVANKCKMPSDSRCSNTTVIDVCMAGSVCDNSKCQCLPEVANEGSNKICVPKSRKVGSGCHSIADCADANAGCVNRKCQCKVGYTADYIFTCNKVVGQPCGSNEDCVKGAKCVHTTCKNEVGRQCKTTEQCVPGTVCDEDGKCHLDFQQSCGSNLNGYCRSDAVCDNTYVCGLPVNSPCSADENGGSLEQCVAGAVCRGNKCRCGKGTDVVISNGQLCLPAYRMIGGECSPVKPCMDSNAKCTKDSVCVCKEGLMNRKDYTCSSSKKIQSASNGLTLGLAAFFSFVIVGAVVASVLYNRKKSKTERLWEEMEHRETATQELRRQSQLALSESAGSSTSQASTPSGSSTALSEATKASAASTALSEATTMSGASTALSEATTMSGASTALSEATTMSQASTVVSEAVGESDDSTALSEATNIR